MNIKEHVLHQVAARYISGKDVEISIDGSRLQMECLEKLLNTSRKLKEELDRGTDLNAVKTLLEDKKKLTLKFQDLTGIIWRL